MDAETFMWGTIFGVMLVVLAGILMWIGYCAGKESK